VSPIPGDCYIGSSASAEGEDHFPVAHMPKPRMWSLYVFHEYSHPDYRTDYLVPPPELRYAFVTSNADGGLLV
jgi:hypothetical protein